LTTTTVRRRWTGTTATTMENKKETKPQMTAYLIEKIVKQYKSHRSAADFDEGFINGIVDRMRVQQ
jgi:hypothetical protein